ncbi:MAG: hypothetical protein ACM3WU_09095 [Bacillota bacterium]
MSFMERLSNLDVRILWVLLVIALLVPMINPMGLPLPMKPETRAGFDFIDSLPSGSWVLMSVNISPMGEPENWPSAIAQFRHFMKKGFKIVLVNTVPEGTMYAERLWKTYGPERDYEYGKDVVQMPFRAGDESAISAMGADFKGLYGTDQYGTPFDQLPIFEGFEGIKSFSLLTEYASTIHPVYYLQQINAKYDIPMVLSIVAVDSPKFMPYMASGQLKGLLSGVAAGAEYELLAQVPGKAAAQMDALSLGTGLFIAAIIVSNIAWWGTRGKASTKGGTK